MIDTSASMEEKLPTAQTAAIRFTNTLRPQDLAQVVQFNDRATTLQPFTNDLAALDAAIRKTDAAGRRAPQRPLHRPQGLMRDKKAAELRRRAIAASLGRRGHRVPRERRAGLELARRARSTSTRSACGRAAPATAATGLQPGGVPRERAQPARPAAGPSSRPRSESSTRCTTGSRRSCARSTASATCRRTPAADGKWRRIVGAPCPTVRVSPFATSSATTRRGDVSEADQMPKRGRGA